MTHRRLRRVPARLDAGRHALRRPDERGQDRTARLQRALRDASLGLYDVLLVYRVDRFARKLSVLVDLLEELDRCGVAFRSATEPIDTSTPTGRMLVQLLGVFAEFERETIIDRVIAAMERKAAKGQWVAGRYPFGYTVPERRKGDDSPNYLVVDETRAPLVPVIFDLYVRKRMGAHAIAKWLNDNGHRTRDGGLWSHMAVLRVLHNRVYVGEVFVRDNWHIAPHPPLVGVDLFEQAQRLLLERGEDYSRRAGNASDYLLSGLVRCARCGNKYTGTVAHGRSTSYRYYTCGSRQRKGAHGCDADRLPADALDDAVLQALLATYRRRDLFDKAVAAVTANADDGRDLRAAELAAVEARIDKASLVLDKYQGRLRGRHHSRSRVRPTRARAGPGTDRPARPTRRVGRIAGRGSRGYAEQGSPGRASDTHRGSHPHGERRGAQGAVANPGAGSHRDRPRPHRAVLPGAADRRRGSGSRSGTLSGPSCMA